MASSLRRFKQCMALSAVMLATVPLSGCFVSQTPSKSALEVGVNEPVGKTKSELTKLVDANPLSGRLHRSADDYIGKVSPAIFNQLKYLPLIAPAYIPEGFSLVTYDIPASGYVLIYGNNSAAQCFAIEYDASKRLTAGNNSNNSTIAAGDVAADSSVSEAGWGQSESGNGPADLSELSVDAALSTNLPAANSPDDQPFIREATEPAVVVSVADMLDFEVFDSPLFGPGQKLFYGAAAEKMAVSELASPQQSPDSDDTALDFLASPDTASPKGSPSTGVSSSAELSRSKPTASVASDQDSFVSQWLRSDEGAYRYMSGATVTQNYSAQNQCGNVSLEEGVKIVTSLAVLSADSTGALESNSGPSANPESLGEGSQN